MINAKPDWNLYYKLLIAYGVKKDNAIAFVKNEKLEHDRRNKLHEHTAAK